MVVLGVSKTLEVFEDVKVLAVQGIHVVKGGVGLGSLGKLLELAKAVNELIKDVPAALPELQDLDQQESAQLAQAAFGLVKSIIEAVKG